MKRYALIILLIFFLLFLLFARIAKYKEFHKATISGKIDTVYRYKEYVMLYVNNVEYRIIPQPLRGSPALEIVAEKGDEIYKRPNSDLFTLTGKNGVLLYTVRKY